MKKTVITIARSYGSGGRTLGKLLAEELGINLCYTAFKVEKDRLHEAVAGADAFDILGMNVTVPHKCEIIKELSDIDPLAARIGAVNTLVRVDGGYKGYNTDAIGLYRELEEENIIIKDKEAVSYTHLRAHET